jgi:hypothetical protein
MRSSLIFVLFSTLAVTGAVAKGGMHSASSSGGSHHVSGHTTKGGTYVQPHQQTNPNKTQYDNWSSKPNVNPYTGKEGTKTPDR